MKAIERLKKYIDYKGFNNSSFEKENGLSNGYIATQLKRNADLGEGVLNKILDNCLDMDPLWVLTGKGSMLKSEKAYDALEGNNMVHEPKTSYFKLKTDNNEQNQAVPLYDIQASASVVALFKDSMSESPIDHISIPNLPKCDGAIYVSGDSMYPLLKSGDIIMYKKIGTSIDNMFWGEMYLVSLINDDGDEFVMVKWLHKSELGSEYVKLVSENRHHQPKDFHIKNIKGLALIKASVRVNSMY
jgi:phage repressor protein C with HTH and peptisase S24 domain